MGPLKKFAWTAPLALGAAALLIQNVFAQNTAAQTGRANPQDQLDSSQALFTVLAAINAAGYDDQINAVSTLPFRRALRDEIAAANLQSVTELKRFFKDRAQRDPNAELSRYISYGLLINGPPDFSYRDPDFVRPPDATELEGLSPLLAKFYKEANLDQQWKKAQPSYDQVIAGLHQPVSRLVLESNAYLRNASNFLGRHFQIYVDILGAPNQVQTRSYGDDTFVVVTPSEDPQLDRIRHAYLHFLVDPLGLRFAADINKKKPLGDYAQGAPGLAQQYKTSFGDLAVECLIKGLESRLDRKPAAATQAMAEGYVLTPALAEQLAAYEKQDTAFRIYFPNLYNAIDFKKEELRLANFEFVNPQQSGRVVRTAQNIQPPELTGQAKAVADAEQAYTDRDLPRARQAYLRILEGPDQQNAHAKSYYGLARIAVLERDPENGDRLFRKVLESRPDAETKSWSLLYLARLADSQGERTQAVENYRAALAVEGVPASVRQAAEKGLEAAFKK